MKKDDTEEEKDMLLIIYAILGYWAAGYTVYSNYVMIGTMGSIMSKKLVVGVMFGWILIPVAILKLLFFRR